LDYGEAQVVKEEELPVERELFFGEETLGHKVWDDTANIPAPLAWKEEHTKARMGPTHSKETNHDITFYLVQ
jgi:hypothetical protein